MLDLAGFLGELDAWARAHELPVSTEAYGTHPDQVVDLRGEDGPLALVVHGGFWRAAYTREIMDAFAIAFARAGWRTANAEYRRLGPGRYREQLEDIAAAADHLQPDVAVGHSAGGHLVLWLGNVRAVSLGGVADLEAAAELGIGNAAVRELLGDDPAALAEAAVKLDAGNVLVHGTDDESVPVELARSYAARAGCELVELEGAGHFELIDPRYARFQEIIDACSRARLRPR